MIYYRKKSGFLHKAPIVVQGYIERMRSCISTSAFALQIATGALESWGDGRVDLNSRYKLSSNKHSPHDCNLDYPGTLFKKERLISL